MFLHFSLFCWENVLSCFDYYFMEILGETHGGSLRLRGAAAFVCLSRSVCSFSLEHRSIVYLTISSLCTFSEAKVDFWHVAPSTGLFTWAARLTLEVSESFGSGWNKTQSLPSYWHLSCKSGFSLNQEDQEGAWSPSDSRLEPVDLQSSKWVREQPL